MSRRVQNAACPAYHAAKLASKADRLTVQTSQPSSKTTPTVLAVTDSAVVKRPVARRMREKSTFQCTNGPENCSQRAGVFTTAAQVRSVSPGSKCVARATCTVDKQSESSVSQRQPSVERQVAQQKLTGWQAPAAPKQCRAERGHQPGPCLSPRRSYRPR